MTDTPKLTFAVSARRVDAQSSIAQCKDATLALDTDLSGTLRRRAVDDVGDLP